jgi:periplasmic protein TonB
MESSRSIGGVDGIRTPLGPSGDESVVLGSLDHARGRSRHCRCIQPGASEIMTEVLLQRALPTAGVISLHVIVIAVLLSNWRAPLSAQPASPLEAVIMEEEARPLRALPQAEVTLAQPRLEMPAPSVDLPEPTPQESNAISVPPALETKAPPIVATPVVAPRFDAAYLNNPAPTYPAVSRRLREEGIALLRVRVTSEGKAAQVLVEHTSGSARLDAAAIDAVERWRFVPAHLGAAAVEAWVLVPIEFGFARH